MPDKSELSKFINKKLKSGYPAGELKNDLLAKGFTEVEIDEAFLNVSTKNKGTGKSSTKENTVADMFALAGVSFLIAGIAMINIPTWLTEYGWWMIIAGIICQGIKFFLSLRNKSST
ncbi:MAG: hypothetical protein WBP16_02950 [Ferruginibacter sp.]